MSESGDMLSSVDSTESVSSREESQGETLDEMEVVGQVQPYADEPLAHISDDEDETTREDEDHRSFASSSTKQIRRRSSRK